MNSKNSNNASTLTLMLRAGINQSTEAVQRAAVDATAMDSPKRSKRFTVREGVVACAKRRGHTFHVLHRDCGVKDCGCFKDCYQGSNPNSRQVPPNRVHPIVTPV